MEQYAEIIVEELYDVTMKRNRTSFCTGVGEGGPLLPLSSWPAGRGGRAGLSWRAKLAASGTLIFYLANRREKTTNRCDKSNM